jgi:predicted RNA binding protein YcfA (HicA-like mRNA interferase family)
MNRSRKTLERKKYWMPKLPILSGKDVIRAPTKEEYVFNHKTGSHITSKTVKEEE